MCVNSNCPKNKECYRFMCEPNPLYQSYASFQPDFATGECDYFMPIYSKTAQDGK